MDTLSHGLYGGIGFGRKSKRDFGTAFLFGIGPDILSFGPYFALSILGIFDFTRSPEGRPDPELIPPFVHTAYDITHSLVVYMVFAAILYAIGKRTILWLSLGWPLHILVDIPTHSHEFFPTPFLWPISEYSINGVSWATPWIFFPNVVLIIILYGRWWYTRRKK